MVVCYLNFSFLSDEVRYIFGAFHLGIGLAAFSGNLLVFLSLVCNRNLRTRSNAILASMATTDFLVGAILQPMHVMQLFLDKFREHCILNTARRMLTIVLSIASFTSVALISYDRYIRLSQSLNYSMQMTVRKVTLLIASCWLVPTVFPLVHVVSHEEKVMTALLSAYIVSNLGVTVISYIYIMRITKKKQKEILQHQASSQKRKRSNYHTQAAKTVSILLICFLITTTPICIFNGIFALKPYLSKQLSGFTHYPQDVFYLIAVTCAVMNSAVNPIIYYAKIPEFRNQLRRMLYRNGILCFSVDTTVERNQHQSTDV